MRRNNALLKFIHKYQVTLAYSIFALLLIRYIYLLFSYTNRSTNINLLVIVHTLLIVTIMFFRNNTKVHYLITLDLILYTIIPFLTPPDPNSLFLDMVHIFLFYQFIILRFRYYLGFLLYIMTVHVFSLYYFFPLHPFKNINVIGTFVSNPTFYILMFLLFNKLRRDANKIYKLAYYDKLTALPNRRLLYQHAKAKLKGKQTLAILYLDLDGFKKVNDTFGHQAGDELLQGVAQRLLAIQTKHIFIGRTGGDEFIIIMERITKEQVLQLAEDIRFSLSQPYPLSNQTVHISASIGVSFIDPSTTTMDDLINLADKNMYRAKQNGKNQICM